MWWFLGLIPTFLKLASVAAIVGTLGWFAWDYTSSKEQVVILQHQVSEHKNQIKVLEASARLSEGAISTLNEVAKTRNADLAEMCSVLGDVTTDPDPEADKPVGGIISRALERLKTLKGNK